MDDMMATLKEYISEEAADAEKYLMMAKAAPPEYACIFSQIAEEEHTHHQHLADILWDMTKHMPLPASDSEEQ